MPTQTMTLPASWAPALINGDTSGLSPSDLDAVDAFRAETALDRLEAIDVGQSTFLARYHDASHLTHGLADTCSDFVFATFRA